MSETLLNQTVLHVLYVKGISSETYVKKSFLVENNFLNFFLNNGLPPGVNDPTVQHLSWTERSAAALSRLQQIAFLLFWNIEILYFFFQKYLKFYISFFWKYLKFWNYYDHIYQNLRFSVTSFMEILYKI